MIISKKFTRPATLNIIFCHAPEHIYFYLKSRQSYETTHNESLLPPGTARGPGHHGHTRADRPAEHDASDLKGKKRGSPATARFPALT